MTKSQFLQYLVSEAEQAYIGMQNTLSEGLKNYYSGIFSALASSAIKYSGKSYTQLLAKYAPDRLKERTPSEPKTQTRTNIR